MLPRLAAGRFSGFVCLHCRLRSLGSAAVGAFLCPQRQQAELTARAYSPSGWPHNGSLRPFQVQDERNLNHCSGAVSSPWARSLPGPQRNRQPLMAGMLQGELWGSVTSFGSAGYRLGRGGVMGLCTIGLYKLST